MFPVWLETACRARVVEAVSLEVTDSFAYGEVVPMPTMSEVVESCMKFVLVHVQPPPDEEPPVVVTASQYKRPLVSAFRASVGELQFATPLTVRLGNVAAPPERRVIRDSRGG